jgi:alpha-amylase
MSRISLFALTASTLVAGSSLFLGCAPAADEPTDTDAIEADQDPAVTSVTPRTAFVHLFEWKWTDIAQECEQFLGPKGFAGVQVSPPNEHAVLSGNPWYERYQPVSYKLESRSGTRAEFTDMVKRCKAVGVDIYVDAVINHMTGNDSGGTGIAGTSYSHYNYPGLYQTQDFHHCGSQFDDIQNYQDRFQVQNCELSNLADLNTGADYVRGKIGGYIADLASLGVAGLRLDASKHMDTGDIKAILGKAGGTPYVYQEVIDLGNEPIHASEYFQNGDVIEFKYSASIGNTFLNGKLADLSQFGPAWGFMPSDSAVVFTDNHDNQRGHGAGGSNVITHKNGTLYDLANVFMLAYPYGYPQVMSSYPFSDPSQGPPSEANGATKNVYANGTPKCFGEWVCEHRFRPIANMVAFRNNTASAFSTSNWWSNGNNQIAFSRGDKGFVAINRESGALSQKFQTGMAAGSYCDVISGDMSANAASCSGGTVTVDAQGFTTITVNAMSAVAIHVGARLGTTPPPGGGGPTPGTSSVIFQVNASTVLGQNIYVVGNRTEIGNWDTSKGVKLDPASYPVWKGTITLPASRSLESKYLKRDGQGQVIWESGANRTLTTPASGSLTLNETFK